MTDDNIVDQAEIERLLGQAGPKAAPPAGEVPATPGAPKPAAPQIDPNELASILTGGGAGTGAGVAAKPAAAPAAASDDDTKLLAQEEIEKLLSQAARPAQAAEPVQAKPRETVEPKVEGQIDPADVEFLFHQAEQAISSLAGGEEPALPDGVRQFRFEELAGAPPSSEAATFSLIRDVELDVQIELGRTHMYLEDVLRLRKGAVVPLDKLAGDPVDIFVNGRLVARGEVLVLNDNFCVRVAELIAGTHVF